MICLYKLKYYSLSKEEKKKLKYEFYETDFGKSINTRLTRLLITGIIGFIFSIYLFLSYTTIWDMIIAISLCSASIIFIISSFIIRISKINTYLVNKKKKK